MRDGVAVSQSVSCDPLTLSEKFVGYIYQHEANISLDAVGNKTACGVAIQFQATHLR